MFFDEISEPGIGQAAKKITIINERQIYVENIKSVIFVSGESISLKLASKTILNISGSNLKIKQFQPQTCEIFGKIYQISFEGRK